MLRFRPERLGHAVFMSSAVEAKLLAMRPPIPVETCLSCHEGFYTFSPLFDKIIQPYHGHGPNDKHHSDMDHRWVGRGLRPVSV